MLITLGIQRDSLLAPVVQKLDRAIHQINLTLTHWIVIYLVDSAIQLLNNWGLV